MKNKQSLTITGLIVILLVWLFEHSGIDIGSEQVQNFIEVIVALVGIATAWYGRWRQKDISILGRKKD